ncbi:Mitochondrial ATPase complex subunit atp10 [Collariella sp. IMI 366227]|nr:Mitochondrial ATPase complex subunit atp10 [Collariella sp. IMI 366227]
MLTRTGLRTGSRTAACLLCQWRSFTVSSRRLADTPPTPKPEPPKTIPPTPGATPVPPKTADAATKEGPLANAPRAYGKALKDFTPTALARPIGMNYPPSAGENTGVDNRSLKQRHADFTNYEKHIQRREYLKSKISAPTSATGATFSKTFLAPPRLFRADLSLYFPNLHGRTLAKPTADTTPLLEGRATVVSVFSSMWAEGQARSFTDANHNPALHELFKEARGQAQLVQVNVEEDMLKAMLVRLFSWSLRKRVGKENWDRYFMVRKGISDEIRESIGLLNSKVGYTYLVDHQCRIRWAGSGQAEPEERDGLVKGMQRILSEMEKEGVDAGFVRKVTMAKKPEQK